MNDVLKAVEKRVLRGDILKILEDVKEKIGALTLCDYLKVRGDWDLKIPQLKLQCQYLAEKGYVEMRDTEKETSGMTIFMVKLTVKGLDLFEGNIPDDPGITMHD